MLANGKVTQWPPPGLQAPPTSALLQDRSRVPSAMLAGVGSRDAGTTVLDTVLPGPALAGGVSVSVPAPGYHQGYHHGYAPWISSVGRAEGSSTDKLDMRPAGSSRKDISLISGEGRRNTVAWRLRQLTGITPSISLIMIASKVIKTHYIIFYPSCLERLFFLNCCFCSSRESIIGYFPDAADGAPYLLLLDSPAPTYTRIL